jgi:hypothetical protein
MMTILGLILCSGILAGPSAQEDNCSVDRWLFLFTLFDLCTRMEEDDEITDSHL